MWFSAFPSWEQYASPADVHREASPGSIQFSIPVPASPRHRLRIYQLGNSVEVAYDDGHPSGPAEKLFVSFDEKPKEVAQAMVRFLRALVTEEVVVVREPLGPVTRFLRRDACDDLPRFIATSDLAQRGGPRSVISWSGSHDADFEGRTPNKGNNILG